MIFFSNLNFAEKSMVKRRYKTNRYELSINFEIITMCLFLPLWTRGRSKVAEVHSKLDVIKFLLLNKYKNLNNVKNQ